MTLRLGVVMDPIESIHFKKDSTLAMLLEAQKRHYTIYYFEQKNLYLNGNVPFGEGRLLTVADDQDHWFSMETAKNMPLSDLDVILMRKDPPFNEEYIYTTYLLEHAERLGVLVVNRPAALRDANEKLFITYFPSCTPKTLVTQSISHLQAFWKTHGEIVCKPLNAMGGASIFRLQREEVNATVIFEVLTKKETSFIMAQQFIPEITKGDKRILLIDGKPFTHALNRIPQGSDWRGNLAVGAIGEVIPLTARDYFICETVGPLLREKGLYFVGLDVIGDYLTEINVTSPTGIREIDAALQSHVSAALMDCIQQLYSKEKND